MVTDHLSAVPPIRGDDQPDRYVLGIHATNRDRRWSRHWLRGSIAGLWWTLVWLVTLVNVAALEGRDTTWVLAILLGIAVWWGTGVLGVVLHGSIMGNRMGLAVERGLTVWRHLPDAERERSKVIAEMMCSAGRRHDVAMVRRCLWLFDRLAVEGQSRPNLIMEWELGLAECWADGARDTHAV